MAVHERARQPIESGGLIEFGPPVADRAALESVPGAGTVEFYLLTEAASRAWAVISAGLASGAGAVFWIGGPSGAGKTHFLNYVMALEERAGTAQGRVVPPENSNPYVTAMQAAQDSVAPRCYRSAAREVRHVLVQREAGPNLAVIRSFAASKSRLSTVSNLRPVDCWRGSQMKPPPRIHPGGDRFARHKRGRFWYANGEGAPTGSRCSMMASPSTGGATVHYRKWPVKLPGSRWAGPQFFGLRCGPAPACARDPRGTRGISGA
jgi:hypothetical protein